MPTKPIFKIRSNSADAVLNAIRNSASVNYQNLVPYASRESNNIQKIGAIIMDMPQLQNEFINTLVNRIARVLITSRSYKNPWRFFKKGLMEFGSTVEEIFVDLIDVQEQSMERAEAEVFKRHIPEIKSAFHTINYNEVYPVTIEQKRLRRAFLSWSGVDELIAYIVEKVYTSAEYDEFQVMKYMLAVRITEGLMYAKQIPTVQTSNMKEIAAIIKGISNDITFMKRQYNIAGVANHSEKERQYLIMNSYFDAAFDVEVLASAFNMDKAQFMGHHVLVDGFGDLDINRLSKLFATNPTYQEFSAEELTALNNIPAVLVDEDFFMVFDNFLQFDENFNGLGPYWNYFYHTDKTFSTSPFAPAILFVQGTPTVTSVTVSPETANVAPGGSLLLTANVVTSNYASQGVSWSLDVDEDVAVIGYTGLLEVASTATGTITVTATSIFDPTKKDTATITVGTGGTG